MADEWISCAEFYRFLYLNSDPAIAKGLIQLEGRTGNLSGRAGRAVINVGAQVIRLSDWQMPPCLWDEAATYSPRLQGRSQRTILSPC